MKKEVIKFLVLLLVAIGAAPATSQVWKWSQTAGSNATADPNINWSIGMAPSAVSGSSRAMMAQLAKYRDDVSGLLVTGGTSTAFTAATNQGLCSSSTTPQDGQELAITVNATNGNAATFQPDGCTAYPIQSAAGTAVAAGTLISGSPYTLKFSNANSAWMLRDFYGSPLNVPLGGLVPYTGASVPNSNFVFPAGQCLSTVTYAAYWTLLGSPSSGSCAGGQFQVIDMRGRVPAALDNLNGTAANRLTSSSSGCGTAMTSVGVTCLNGVEGASLTLAQLPTGITSSNGSQSISVSTAVNGSGLSRGLAGVSGSLVAVQATGGNSFVVPAVVLGGTWETVASVSGTNSISVTSNNTAGAAHPSVQPTIGLTYLLRVL